MTIHERQDIEDTAAAADTREERLAHRVADLYAGDPQFAAAKPDPAVVEAARGLGVRLAEVLQTFADGYADRPALGQHAREFVTDSATGRTSGHARVWGCPR
jgi:fatty acid CoA ligase FadD9